jgi:hypothetical protein
MKPHSRSHWTWDPLPGPRGPTLPRDRMWEMKKYPDDMVENLGESGDVLGQSGECPNDIPKREPFSLSGSKKGEKEEERVGFGKEKDGCLTTSRGLGPTRAWHGRTVRDTPADSPRGERTVRTPGADCPLFLPERPKMHLLPMSHADGLRCPGGQSARSSRTVRPVAADGPTSLFKFSVI